MFKPAKAVQTRELNEIQSIFKKQIERFGDHVFQNGSSVIPGDLTINKKHDYIEVLLDNITDPSLLLGLELEEVATGIKAIVDLAIDADGDDPITLYITYVNSGGGDSSTGTFSASSILTATSTDTSVGNLGVIDLDVLAAPAANGEPVVGKATTTTINDGVYYVNGYFVLVANQIIPVSKYSQDASKRIGFVFEDTVITVIDDTELFDNAKGTTNENAPGADRLKIDLILTALDETPTVDTDKDFIELARLKNGVTIQQVRGPSYSQIGEVLAKRTFEESGNYTVNPFNTYLQEHENPSEDAKFQAAVSPGIGYVNGYRAETSDTVLVDIDKARDTRNTETFSNLDVGNYFVVKETLSNTLGFPDINGETVIALYDGLEAGAISPPSSIIGYAKVRFFEYAGIDVNLNKIFKLYVYDITMNAGNTTREVLSLGQSGSPSFSANTVTTTDWLNAPSGSDPDARLFESSKRALIAPLEYEYVDVINDINYSVRKHGTINISTGTGTLAKPSNGEIDTDFDNRIKFYAVVKDGNGQTDDGTVIDDIGNGLSGGGVSNLTIDLSSTSASAQTGGTIELWYTVNLVAPVRKTKAQTTETQVITFTSPSPRTFRLNRGDVISITSILEGAIDRTDDFILDTGQRDSFYDSGNITLLATATAVQDDLTVEFEYYTHSAGDYISVDSYPASTTQEQYQDSKGNVYNLSDVIDFRPLVENSYDGDIVSLYSGDGSAYDDAGGSLFSSGIPVLNENLVLDLDYFLARIDKVAIDTRGFFTVIKGNPDVNPNAPDDRLTAMTLFMLNIPPYTSSVEDVDVVVIDNRRFTMRDIGRIKSRVENLEEVTSLALLELEVADFEILDENGSPRYRSGFIVDTFKDFGPSSPSDVDYSIALDQDLGEARPMFNNIPVDLKPNLDSSTTMKFSGDSEFEDIYEVESDQVTLLLGDDYEFVSDDIIRIRDLDDNIINSANYTVYEDDAVSPNTPNSVVFNSSQGSGTKFLIEVNEYGDDDIIDSATIDFTELKFLTQPSRSSLQLLNPQRKNISIGALSIKPNRHTWWSKELAPDVLSNALKYEGTKVIGLSDEKGDRKRASKSLGIRWKSWDLEWFKVDSDTQIMDVIVNYIRPAKIKFKGRGLKANTLYYAFFDGIDVTQFVQSKGKRSEFGQAILSDKKGKVKGSLYLPADPEGYKFRTGWRNLRLTDSINNDENVTSFADAPFFANGYIKDKDNKDDIPRIAKQSKKYRAGQTVIEQIEPMAQSFVCNLQGGGFLTKVGVYFGTINAAASDIIEFGKKKSKKDNAYPVTERSIDDIPTISVRVYPVTDGIPSSEALPHSDVTLFPEQIKGDILGQDETTFTFDSPLYLQEGVEYALVFDTPSDAYSLWVGTRATEDKDTGHIVNEFSGLGRLFVSDNNVSWDELPDKALKVNFYAAQFSSSGTIVVEPKFKLPLTVEDGAETGLANKVTNQRYGDLENPFLEFFGGTVNIFETREDEYKVRVRHYDHGFRNNDSVMIHFPSTAGSVGGINFSDIQGMHVVSDVSYDSYTIDLSAVATSPPNTTDARDNASEGVYISRNARFDMLRSNIDQLILPDTNVTWQAIYRDEANIEQTINLNPNRNTFVDNAGFILSRIMENTLNPSQRSFRLVGTLTSDNVNLSPWIDMETISVGCFANRINIDTDPNNDWIDYVEATAPRDSTAMAQYVTKPIPLVTPANSLKVFLGAYRPSEGDIDVYYRLIQEGSSDNISNKEYTLMNSIVYQGPSVDVGDFKDYEWAEDYLDDEFTTVQIKIVLKSTNTSRIPRLKDYRTLALAT